MTPRTALAHVPTTTQRRLPRVRNGQRLSVSVAGVDFDVITDLDDNNQLCALHLVRGQGPVHGMLTAWVDLMSVALLHNVPLDEIVGRFINTHFEPSGYTDDPEIPHVKSVIDYLARRLARDHLPRARQNRLGAIERPRTLGMS